MDAGVDAEGNVEVGGGDIATRDPVTGDPAGRRRLRRITAGLLGVVAVVGLVVSLVAGWARSVLFDSDRVAAAVEQSLEQPEVVRSLAVYLTAQVDAAVGVDDVVDELLPPALDRLRPAIAGGIQVTVERGVERVLATDEARSVLVGATRQAHEAAVRVLRGDSAVPGVAVSDGEVSVNLLPLVGRALQRLQSFGLLAGVTVPDLGLAGDPVAQIESLERALSRDLPDGFAQLVVYRNDGLAAAEASVERARDLVSLLDRLYWIVIAATLVAAVAAVVLARDRRRAVFALTVGALAALVLARALVVRVVAKAPDALTDPGARQALATAVDQLGGVLIGLVSLMAFVLLVAGTVLWVSGPGVAASSLRARLGSGGALSWDLVRRQPGVVAGGAVALALLALTVGGTDWWVLVIAALLAGFGVVVMAVRPAAA